jgi:hypothetical protein
MPYRPLFFARVTSENHELFLMRMSAEWFKAAKAHMDLPALGRSVHHVKGQCVQRTLTLQVHHKSPSEPKNWEFEVLTKMVIVKQQKSLQKNGLPMRELSSRLAHSNPHPKNQNRTYLRKQRVKHAEKTGKIRNPPMKTTEPIKNKSELNQMVTLAGITRYYVIPL